MVELTVSDSYEKLSANISVVRKRMHVSRKVGEAVQKLVLNK